MQITGVGGFVPWLPAGPGGPRSGGEPAAPTPATAATQASSAQTLVVQALQQVEEQRHVGGGGGGHGHAGNKKNPMSALEDLAARASLKIEVQEKTPLERMMEIERLKLLANIRAGRVNAKGEQEQRDGRGNGGHQPNHQEPDKDATQAEESPAAPA